MSENPPTGPQYGGGSPDPSKPDLNKPEGGYPPPGNYPPPPGNYPPPPGNYPPPPANYPPPSGSYPPPPGNYPPPPGAYPPPPGAYPPPPGAYSPPPGSYPPPPAYGQNPGYPAGPAFGGPGIPGQLSVGAALSYGWEKFKNNALVWIGIIVIAAVIELVISLVFSSNSIVVSILQSLISGVVSFLISAALTRGALHEIDGNKPAFGSFFQFSNIPAIIIASVIVGIATGIGYVLLVIPGLIVMFLTWWTLSFVIDQGQDAITAIKSSFTTITANPGPILVLALALVGINIVGAILLGIGLLVTIPVSIIASTYAYRVSTGRFVAAK